MSQSTYEARTYGSQPMWANGTLLRVAKNKFTIEIHSDNAGAIA